MSLRQGLGQHVSMRQDLRINPRLYQAMDLLYMPLLDLQQHLKQELLANPFLEMSDTDAEEVTVSELEQEREKKAEEPQETNWEDILLDGFGSGGWKEGSEEKEYREPVTVQRQGLTDYLREQLQMLTLDGRQMLLCETMVGNIADDGYVSSSLDEVVRCANELLEEFAEQRPDLPRPEPFTEQEAERSLRTVQSLDPAGIGARNLRECLILQLRDQGRTDTLEYRLLEEAYDDFIAHRWSELGKRLGIDPAEVQKAADNVAKLDPKPGLRHGSGGDDYIVPDLVVDKVDGEYRVFLNDHNLPRLRLSRAYQEVARDKKKFVGENREFFEKGIEYLKPLTLREVAEVINMHESTVSRVTNEKWVQTPRGVLPLKFFFSSALSTTSGEDASARAIRAQIEKLVGDESALDPLTDQQIVQKLKERGVRIARRTVAKYRDQLGILSARMRRRV